VVGHRTNDHERLTSGTQEDLPGGRGIYGYRAAKATEVAGTLLVTMIADSYTWFANEAFWTATCGRSFIMALTGDDIDPLCNESQCTDNRS
jgi:hypothetical protein